MIANSIRATVRRTSLVARQCRFRAALQHTGAVRILRVDEASSSPAAFLAAGIATTILLASAYSLDQERRGTKKTECDSQMMIMPGSDSSISGMNVLHAQKNTEAQEENDSSIPSMKVLHALEVKEEMQKVRLARFLRELHDLAAETKGRKICKYATEKIAPIGSAIDDGQISLREVDLTKLTPADAETLIHALRAGDRLDRESFIKLAKTATTTLKQDPTLVDLRGKVNKVTVVGDLHGSLNCLTRVLELAGNLDEDRALVIDGDFVDRGPNSLEVICTLLLLKLARPEKVVLLRGNHEDTMIASVYGFQEEIREKYGHKRSQPAWDELSNVFAALPIAARTEAALILHGGIPSADFRLSELEAITAETRSKIKTVVEPRNAQEKLLENILWSDPSVFDGVEPNPRGCGIEFGPDIAKDFLERHDLKYLVRGHEPAENGIQALDCEDGRYVVTVFSTAAYPNGEGSNLGAIVSIDAEGFCQPVNFEYTGKQKNGVGVNPYEDALRSFIAENRHKLEKAFDEISQDGLVTPSQWSDIMETHLDLGDVSWASLQPKLAPFSESDADRIDWHVFLNSFAPGTPNLETIKGDQVAILHEHNNKILNFFKILDVDGNGSVDRGEFIAGVELLNKHHLPEDKQLQNPEELFDVFDLDGNGEIDIDEFCEVLTQSATLSNVTEALDENQMSVLQENRDMLLTVFKFLDLDGNGGIDYKEFVTGIELLNKRLPDESKIADPGELFRALDLDGSGEIDIEEFNQIFQFV